ncbi:MAG: FAD-dependent oxidoreductase [PVC group bacterium]|nr:FAD-dependent oxidoreductase [PVC group bacterium]
MKIAIIGAGISGLLTAYYLKGYADVTVYEKEADAGGLSASIAHDGIRVEKYNHFISVKDEEFIRVVSMLGLEEELQWARVKHGFILGDNLWGMNTPGELFFFSHLSWTGKIKLAKFMIKASLRSDARDLQDISARDWIEKECGKDVFRSFFEPLLEYKFTHFEDVTAAYLWARINEGKKNKIGCLRNGLDVVFGELKKQVSQKAQVLFNSPVKKIVKNDSGLWRVITNREDKLYDLVISTISIKQTSQLGPELLKITGDLNRIDYLSVSSLILAVDQPLKNGWWLFMADQGHGGKFGMRVVVDAFFIAGKNFVYFPVYQRQSQESIIEKEQLLQECFQVLKRINPGFNEAWVKKHYFFQDKFVEPVLNKNFFRLLNVLPEDSKGLYIHEAVFQEGLLKTLNTSAIKSRIIAEQIRNNDVRNNSG